VVVGLDPYFQLIPGTVKEKFSHLYNQDAFEYAAKVILEFNKQIIDTVVSFVGVIKLQIAFYELYNWWGIWAFAETIKYAKQKGLIVISDIKRGDVPTTAEAYANAHMGMVAIDNIVKPSFSADAVTANPFLGTDSLLPFISVAEKHQRGIFILVKTSNPSSGEFQDILCEAIKKLYQIIAEKTHYWGNMLTGKYGYSSIGAVVGATYPKDIVILRNLMPNNYFLVPGYGAQGATAKDVAHCFNADGRGALVNASRSLLYAYNDPAWKDKYGINTWKDATQEAVIKMNESLKNIISLEK